MVLRQLWLMVAQSVIVQIATQQAADTDVAFLRERKS